MIFIIRIYNCLGEQIIISESLDIWDVSIWKSSNMDIIWSSYFDGRLNEYLHEIDEEWYEMCDREIESRESDDVGGKDE